MSDVAKTLVDKDLSEIYGCGSRLRILFKDGSEIEGVVEQNVKDIRKFEFYMVVNGRRINPNDVDVITILGNVDFAVWCRQMVGLHYDSKQFGEWVNAAIPRYLKEAGIHNVADFRRGPVTCRAAILTVYFDWATKDPEAVAKLLVNKILAAQPLLPEPKQFLTVRPQMVLLVRTAPTAEVATPDKFKWSPSDVTAAVWMDVSWALVDDNLMNAISTTEAKKS